MLRQLTQGVMSIPGEHSERGSSSYEVTHLTVIGVRGGDTSASGIPGAAELLQNEVLEDFRRLLEEFQRNFLISKGFPMGFLEFPKNFEDFPHLERS